MAQLTETQARLDRIVVGANPLTGVDHFLGERARERSIRLTDEAIRQTLNTAFHSGATGFTFNVGEPTRLLLGTLLPPPRDAEVGLYGLVPDSEFVSNVINQGTSSAITTLLRDTGAIAHAAALLKGGWAALTNDVGLALMTYISAEASRLRRVTPRGFRLRSILLHELVTDALLSLRLSSVLSSFIKGTRELDLIPGLVTRNFSALIRFCDATRVPLDRVLIMAPFNPIGFQMTPNRESCEEALRNLQGPRVMAISLLAGGRVSLDEGIAYLQRLAGISSVAVGVSTPGHAAQTFARLGGLASGWTDNATRVRT